MFNLWVAVVVIMVVEIAVDGLLMIMGVVVMKAVFVIAVVIVAVLFVLDVVVLFVVVNVVGLSVMNAAVVVTRSLEIVCVATNQFSFGIVTIGNDIMGKVGVLFVVIFG